MRSLLPLVVATALITGPALAQTNPPAQNIPPASEGTGTATGSSNDAVNPSGNASSSVNASGTVNLVAPSALENGANSFTEGQAKSRIEGAGFTNVSGLNKDAQGIWRGQAMRNGKSVAVGFDYKGNIAAQ